jgi:hypothetical protein
VCKHAAQASEYTNARRKQVSILANTDSLACSTCLAKFRDFPNATVSRIVWRDLVRGMTYLAIEPVMMIAGISKMAFACWFYLAPLDLDNLMFSNDAQPTNQGENFNAHYATSHCASADRPSSFVR